ncbi:MAG: LytTR family DNA-binding domain-containing protein [Rhodobacteraceae bacterium]|nr:LytTR family DNA-binding domain-containing protein [Paracoccaceae bacterium]
MIETNVTLWLTFANLHKEAITLSDVKRLATSRISWVWICAVCLSVLYIQPILPGVSWPRLVRGLMNIAAGSLGQLIYLALLSACLKLTPRLGLRRIYSPLASLVAAIAFTHFCASMTVLVVGHPLAKGWSLLASYTMDLILFEGQALLFGTFVLRALLDRGKGKSEAQAALATSVGLASLQPEPAAPPVPETVVIAARAIATHKILLVTARGKFVEIVTTEQSYLLRAKLSDTLAKLAAVPGIQVHRSHWVARAGVRCRKLGGAEKLVLVMKNQTEIAVAPTRIAVVSTWLDQMTIPIMPDMTSEQRATTDVATLPAKRGRTIET